MSCHTGCVVDKQLFEKVQEAVKSISHRNDKNNGVKHIYILSGLVSFRDGTPFHGTGAHGRNRKCLYYYNKSQDIRIDAEVLEKAVIRTVSEIIKNSSKVQDGLIRHASEVSQAEAILKREEDRLRSEIMELEDERKKLDRRLDFLLDGATDSELKRFKTEYKTKSDRIASELEKRQQTIEAVKRKIADVVESEVNKEVLKTQAEEILELVKRKDPAALKTGLRKLIRTVEMGEIDSLGKRLVGNCFSG